MPAAACPCAGRGGHDGKNSPTAQIIYSLICLIGFISLIGSIGCIDLSVGTTEYLLFAQPIERIKQIQPIKRFVEAIITLVEYTIS
jgi:hypothetical protein